MRAVAATPPSVRLPVFPPRARGGRTFGVVAPGAFGRSGSSDARGARDGVDRTRGEGRGTCAVDIARDAEVKMDRQSAGRDGGDDGGGDDDDGDDDGSIRGEGRRTRGDRGDDDVGSG